MTPSVVLTADWLTERADQRWSVVAAVAAGTRQALVGRMTLWVGSPEVGRQRGPEVRTVVVPTR